jgi:hypothetical protein
VPFCGKQLHQDRFGCGSAALGSFVANPPEWYLTGAEAAEDDVVAWEELHRGNRSAVSASSCKVVVPTVLFLQEGTEETEISRIGTLFGCGPAAL